MKFLKSFTVFCLFLFVASSAFATNIEIVEDAQAPQGQTLMDAINYLHSGALQADTLILVTSGGQYGVDKWEHLVPLTIMAAPGLAEKPELHPKTRYYKGNEIIQIRNDLALIGIVFDGTVLNSTELDSIKRVFKVYLTEEGPNKEPNFTLINCDFRNVFQNGNPEDVEGKLIEFDKSATCGAVYVENCTFTNFGDEVFNAGNAYKSSHVVTPAHGGHFSSFTMRNCTFNNVDGSCIKLNGDADSTTIDGVVLLENLTFYNCQRRVIWTRDLMNETVRNILIVNSKRGHETFSGTGELIHVEMIGSTISHVDTFNIVGVKADGDTVTLAEEPFVAKGGEKNGSKRSATLDRSTIYYFDPMFEDPENGDFTLKEGSKLYYLGHDGGPIGDRRWAKYPPQGTSISIKADAEAPVGQTLMDAINYIHSGALQADTLILETSGGQYGIDKWEHLVPLTIKAAPGLAEKPQLRPKTRYYKGNEIIQIRNDLALIGIVFDGTVMNSTELDSIKRVFKVYNTEEGPNKEPDIKFINCDFRNVFQNGNPEDTEGKLIEFDKSASAGIVYVENCTFTNFGDEVFNAGNAYKSSHVVTVPHGGHFSHFTVRNSTFNNVDGSCIKLNGDADSTTVDGIVLLENITFYNCQRRVIWTRDLMNETVRNIIIANSKKGHETFSGTDELIHVEMYGSTVSNVDTFNIVGVKADGDTVFIADDPFVVKGGEKNGSKRSATINRATIYGLDPMFEDPENGDFTLKEGSPLYTLGHDGGALGDRNWAKYPPTIAVEENKSEALPTTFSLKQNYPNPFNPKTTIAFSLDKYSHVKLQIYNIVGQLVETLVDADRPAGLHKIIWDASKATSGIYFYRLQAGDRVSVKKMTLLK